MDRYITRTPNNNRQRLIKGPANHNLMVIQLNCGPGGLNSIKKLELENYLYNTQPDIVLLQETWFKDKKTPQFHGYSMIHRNRLPTYKTTGGGVAILIRESAGITFAPITEITAPDDQCTDIVQAKIKWKGRDLTVTSLYNPPVSSRPRNRQGFSAEYTLSACARHGTNHIIGGDFNAHSMTWDSAEDVVESEEGDQIVEWLRENDATQEIRHHDIRAQEDGQRLIYQSIWVRHLSATGGPSLLSASLTTSLSHSTLAGTTSLPSAKTSTREIQKGKQSSAIRKPKV